LRYAAAAACTIQLLLLKRRRSPLQQCRSGQPVSVAWVSSGVVIGKLSERHVLPGSSWWPAPQTRRQCPSRPRLPMPEPARRTDLRIYPGRLIWMTYSAPTGCRTASRPPATSRTIA